MAEHGDLKQGMDARELGEHERPSERHAKGRHAPLEAVSMSGSACAPIPRISSGVRSGLLKGRFLWRCAPEPFIKKQSLQGQAEAAGIFFDCSVESFEKICPGFQFCLVVGFHVECFCHVRGFCLGLS